MRPRFEDVAILCPPVVTGGPEALHQLGSMIRQLKGRAFMVYGDECLPADHPVIEAYGGYFVPQRPNACTAGQKARALVVIPEIWAGDACLYSRSAVYWLSVDTAIAWNPMLGARGGRAHYFATTRDVLHLAQSHYALHWLHANGARRVLPVFDYVTPWDVPSGLVRDRVAVLPTRNPEALAELRRLAPDLPWVEIRGMTKREVAKALASSIVYVDLGHHPGKDRVPREAASLGAVVLLNRAGAALHYADHPLDDVHLIDAGDLPAVVALIRGVLADYRSHYLAQAPYRARVEVERDEFVEQVRAAFFVPEDEP